MARPLKLTITEIQKAALLHCRGMEQAKIQERLGLSQSSTSRALKRAREGGWLEDVPHLALDSGRIQELEQLLYAPELLDKLKPEQPTGRWVLQQLRIFEVSDEPIPPSREAYEENQAAFGKFVAEYLVEHVFPHVRSMGVTWGGTLEATVRSLPSKGALADPAATIDFFPVCGDPPDAILGALRSSSNLVAQLDDRVNGRRENLYNFAGVCAAIPKVFDKQADTLWKYFRANPAYTRVFGLGQVKGMLHTMDAVLTSVGAPHRFEDPWIDGAAKAADMSPETLVTHTHGNVGGYFLPKEDIGSAAKDIRDVNRRWTGIGLDQFEKCARRAKRRKTGGTVLVGFGPKKAETTLECIRLGLVSHVLIDNWLAAELTKLLDK